VQIAVSRDGFFLHYLQLLLMLLLILMLLLKIIRQGYVHRCWRQNFVNFG
jgi:hypothetical protein